MQGFYNITEQIRLQLSQDEFVNTVTYGDIFRVDLKKQTIFPLSHVVVNNATIQNNIVRYSISVMAMDIVDISNDPIVNSAIGQFRGNDNEQDVLNTQQAVLMRLLKVLEGGTLHEALYQLDGNPTLEPFTERFENYLAGWVATFDVLIPNDMTACDGATIPTNTCEDAIAITTDSLGNQLYSNIIPSGDTETQVIQDSAVTVNSLPFADIQAEGSLDIPVLDTFNNPVGSQVLTNYIIDNNTVNINGTNVYNALAEETVNLVVNLDGVPSGSWDGNSWEVVSACADTTIQVNGTTEGTFASGSTVDIQLSDSGGVVTPDSVTIVGNDVQIVLADAPTNPSGATILKTGRNCKQKKHGVRAVKIKLI